MSQWATLNYPVECIRTHDDHETEFPKGALVEVTFMDEYELYFNDVEGNEFLVEGESPDSLFTYEEPQDSKVRKNAYSPVPNMTPQDKRLLL